MQNKQHVRVHWLFLWGWGWGRANDDDDDDEENNENNEDVNLSSGGSHSGKSSLTEYLAKVSETMVAVHGLTMMHSAHNLIMIMIFDHQDDSFIFDTTKWPTFKWQSCDNVIDKEPDKSDEGPQSVKDISVISSRLWENNKLSSNIIWGRFSSQRKLLRLNCHHHHQDYLAYKKTKLSIAVSTHHWEKTREDPNLWKSEFGIE